MPFLSPMQHELRVLKSSEKRIIALTVFGSFFSSIDFTIYITFKEILTKVFFSQELPEWLSTLSFFIILVSGYILRPIGGIIMANYGDRYGRKPMLMLSLVILSAATLAIAVIPSYAHI